MKYSVPLPSQYFSYCSYEIYIFESYCNKWHFMIDKELIVELISSSHSDVLKNMLSFRVYVTKGVNFMIIQSGLINKMFKTKPFLPLLVKRCMAASASTRLFQYMTYLTALFSVFSEENTNMSISRIKLLHHCYSHLHILFRKPAFP